ncbi:thermonuclease family protein [Patescibacteria group bacterium]|nr:thermonuclease family protein [Patescibacteria group bacterium]
MDQKHSFLVLSSCGLILVACALILARVATSGLGAQLILDQQTSAEVSETVENPTVAKVIDGDTIALTDGRRVRYIGINTPEMADMNKQPQCFAPEAKAENEKLLAGKTIRLEKDTTNRDKYGRLLRYVYATDSSGREIFVNDYLVRQGYARPLPLAPDLHFASQFNAAAEEAKFQDRGLWSACN